MLRAHETTLRLKAKTRKVSLRREDVTYLGVYDNQGPLIIWALI